MKTVVRVATSNNFNCTDAEYAQLDQFAAEHPDKLFFVNCNVNTPLLHTLRQHPYKAVITVNPNLTLTHDQVQKALSVAERVSFYRVKWLPGFARSVDQATVIEALIEVAPVVITMQRFRSLATLERYTNKDYYAHDCAMFRLHGEALRTLEQYVDGQVAKGRQLFICDRKGLGCLGCGLCTSLNGAPDAEVKSLNLSTSGVCPYSCPDCYAKSSQQRVKKGCSPIAYDQIKANAKQRGATKHIQNARKGK